MFILSLGECMILSNRDSTDTSRIIKLV